MIIRHAAAAVVARPGAAVRHVHTAVEAEDGVRVDDEQFDAEVEAVEARLGVVPGWVGEGPRCGVVDAGAEAGAKRQEEGCAGEQEEPRAVAADAELLGACAGGAGEEADGYDGHGEEGEDGAGGGG